MKISVKTKILFSPHILATKIIKQFKQERRTLLPVNFHSFGSPSSKTDSLKAIAIVYYVL
jgi:hypothetical protein